MKDNLLMKIDLPWDPGDREQSQVREHQFGFPELRETVVKRREGSAGNKGLAQSFA